MLKNTSDGVIVLCPVCASEYTHHINTKVYERLNGEDGQTVVLTPGLGELEQSDFNPSKRRNAVAIEFQGECGHFFTMYVVQHKGVTYIQFP